MKRVIKLSVSGRSKIKVKAEIHTGDNLYRDESQLIRKVLQDRLMQALVDLPYARSNLCDVRAT